jgi:hypothetical protein
MTKNDIRKARNSLKINPIFYEIINKKDGFYYYYNWQAGEENKLHYCECGHCAFGSGKHADSKEGKNGVWIGPFENRDIAKVSLKTRFNIGDVEDCGHCVDDKPKN